MLILETPSQPSPCLLLLSLRLLAPGSRRLALTGLRAGQRRSAVLWQWKKCYCRLEVCPPLPPPATRHPLDSHVAVASCGISNRVTLMSNIHFSRCQHVGVHEYVCVCVSARVSVCVRERENSWHVEGEGAWMYICSGAMLHMYISRTLSCAISRFLCTASVCACIHMLLSMSARVYFVFGCVRVRVTREGWQQVCPRRAGKQGVQHTTEPWERVGARSIHYNNADLTSRERLRLRWLSALQPHKGFSQRLAGDRRAGCLTDTHTHKHSSLFFLFLL